MTTIEDVLAQRAKWCVIEGDSRVVVPTFPAACINAVVTDPPSGISFMGAAWDHHKGGRAQWVAWLAAILAASRVACVDGARLVSWAMPRTSHWTGCAIEDAGWTIETKGYHLFGCLTPDTEILVNGEWVSYDKATPGNLALCYDSERDSLSWKPIGELVTYEHHQHLYRLRGEFTDQLVTRGHRCPVYRDGRVVFLSADEVAEGGTALVPVLEDVRRVLAALPLPQCARGVSEDVRGGVSCGAPANAAEDAAPDLRDVRGGVHAEGQQAPRVVSVLLGGVLREVARGEPGDRRAPARRGDAGQGGMDGHVASVVPREDDRAEQPRVEGRRDARVLEGELRAGRVRALPDGVPFDGAARRVDSGTQAARGAGARTDAHDIGERASRQSQPAGQPAREPDALRDELGSQEVRASRFARADLVRVSPEHHDGIVWCVTVPTGAFVARRNGQVFITGNTGWPKGKSQLKPAAEEWIFARTGRSTPLNIDACRVGTSKENPKWGAASTAPNNVYGKASPRSLAEDGCNPNVGRYPPNVTLGHADGCVLAGVRRVRGGNDPRRADGTRAASPTFAGLDEHSATHEGYADHDGTETVDAWECVEGCAVAALDAQVSEETSESVGFQSVLPVESGAWQTQNDAHGEPSTTGAGTGCGESREADESSGNSNTDGCGSRPTDQSPTGSTSTTSTTTGQTTDSKTSKPSKARSTDATTRATAKTTASSTGSNSAPVSGATSTSHSLSSARAPQEPDTDTARSAGASTSATGSERTQPQRSGDGSTTRPSSARSASRSTSTRAAPTAGQSRFFPQFEHEAPFLYCAKPSGAEKRAGLDDGHARHPTVKPVALMRWLIRLTTQPGDIVLDPFCGSATTGVAALLEGRRFIGIERDPAFAPIARARLEHAAPSRERLATMASTPVRVEAADFGPLFNR